MDVEEAREKFYEISTQCMTTAVNICSHDEAMCPALFSHVLPTYDLGARHACHNVDNILAKHSRRRDNCRGD